MLIVMKCGSTREEVGRVRDVIDGLGFDSRQIPLEGGRVALRVAGYAEPPNSHLFETLPGVEIVLPVHHVVERASRHSRKEDSIVRVGGREIGSGGFTLVAGPCAVEEEEQVLAVARAVRQAGADMLRGGAYKPRSSPYDFQGIGEPGLRMLARARQETGLPVITEAVDEASLALVEEYGDVVQIGARNMQNFQLLKRAGRGPRPVLLKRGMAATVEDLLLSAEYVLDAGNPNVILCERGIRTFATHSRFTLDLSVLPVLERITHLPVFVDPSHASGRRSSVAALARAALAAGADGVLIEVHVDPDRALSDGPQSLRPSEFAALAATLRALEPVIAREREVAT
jgi:3-deoxy-7-phosphoheptulonate synthase